MRLTMDPLPLKLPYKHLFYSRAQTGLVLSFGIQNNLWVNTVLCHAIKK
jgi:hypothetical protein